MTQIMYLGEHEQYTAAMADGTLVKIVDYNPEQRKAGVDGEVKLIIPTSRVVILDRD